MSHSPVNMVLIPPRRQEPPHTWHRWSPHPHPQQPQHQQQQQPPHQQHHHHQPWGVSSQAFVMEQSYTPMITHMSPPQYPVHHGFVYDPYDAPGAGNSAVSPSKQYVAERTMLDMAPVATHSNMAEPVEDVNHMNTKQQSHSPVIKSESQPPEAPKDSKTDSAPPAEGQAPDVVFGTGIDRLMKIIQQKSDMTGMDASETQNKLRTRVDTGSASVPGGRKRKTDTKEKPHACRRKKCQKRFTQITHLHIHDRAHTGEKPHKCTFAGCSKSFTQKGNLRTHERRHLGERPFKCHVDGCNRAFPQKGNLAAHLETHYKRNTFRCILKSCGKTFSSRGNLKTHQNNYHKDELHQLELKFASVRAITDMTEADRELWNYFMTVHKNSNKGIKGRGKECRVEQISHANNLPSQCSLQAPPDLHAAYPISQGVPHSMGFSHFGMQRNHLGQDFLVSRGTYEVYEIDQASISSGTMTPASSPGGMYDDHNRSLSFHHERGMY